MSQNSTDSLILRKWYYCDTFVQPDNLEMMLFYSDPETINCYSNQTPYYWEFKKNGELLWTDSQQNSQSTIIDGVIFKPNYKWSWQNDNLKILNNEFVIDVLTSKHLIIHRKEE